TMSGRRWASARPSRWPRESRRADGCRATATRRHPRTTADSQRTWQGRRPWRRRTTSSGGSERSRGSPLVLPSSLLHRLVLADFGAAGTAAAHGPVPQELLHASRAVDFHAVHIAFGIDADDVRPVEQPCLTTA